MILICPRCLKRLETRDEPPTFCSFCGVRLSSALSPSLTPTSDATEAQSSGSDASATQTFEPSGKSGPRWGLLSSETIAGYRLRRTLGQGGMGIVYEAEEVASGRMVALKRLTTDFHNSAAVERFRREGRIASAIEHPRCVFVIAADEFEGVPYIVMELMPGQTLRDLIEERGPLDPLDAVLKILDVIDGLRAAHRVDVLHRDVKPSNCFLEPNGRVKVGDFGLSKTMDADSNITRTGLFLGTPLYASPEQIKREVLDERSDVYSTAATLYYLLAGRAPFEEVNDAAAVLAKIASEPAPSLRTIRPGTPPVLDAIIRKGLERNRDRRWRSLHEFGTALLRFVPNRLNQVGLGLRVLAYLIDFALFTAALMVLQPFVPDALGELTDIAVSKFMLLYFFLCETIWGATVGKAMLRLRVYGPQVGSPPSWRRAGARVLIFYAVAFLPGHLADAFFKAQADRNPHYGVRVLLLAVPLLLLFAGARARNGYQGFHERFSGTRTAGLPKARRSFRWKPRSSPSDQRPESANGDDGSAKARLGMPTIGPYEVRGVLGWADDRKIILGEDACLKRSVWIAMRPASGSEPSSAARRTIARPARLRWVTSGVVGDERWEAISAPKGTPLTAVTASGGRLPWPNVLHMLETLIKELRDAAKEETIPNDLTPAQVWVRPDGAVQLADFPLGEPTAPSSKPNDSDGDDEQQALKFLGAVARQGLDGQTEPQGDAPLPIRAPIPEHAAQLLARLLGAQTPAFETLEELDEEFARLLRLRPELSKTQRLIHAGAFWVWSLLVLAVMNSTSSNQGFLIGVGIALALCETIYPGGPILILLESRYVRRWNRALPIGWAAVRGLVAWLPIALFALAFSGGSASVPGGFFLPLWLATAAIWPTLCALHAAIRPGQLLQDRIVGATLVPK